MYAKDAKYLFINNLAATGIKTSGNVFEVSDLLDGQIAFVGLDGVALAGGGAASSKTTTPFRVVIRNGNELIWSPYLVGSNTMSESYPVVTVAKNNDYAGMVEQVSYVGYNYTSGSIDVINSNYYKIRMLMIEPDVTGQSRRLWKYGMYQSLTSDTQSNIAYELTKSLINNFSREVQKTVYFDRVYSGAVTGGTWTDNYLAWTVTQNSPYITSDEAHGYSTVGAIINLAGLCFIVTEITSATVLKLDIAWQHPSGYVIWDDAAGASVLNVVNGSRTSTISNNAEAPFNVAGTVVYFDAAGVFVSGVMADTTTGVTLDVPFQGTTGAKALAGGIAAAGGNWGIRMEGQKRNFDPKLHGYQKVRFDVGLDGFTATTVTKSVGASEGTGTYEEVAEMEFFAQGFERGSFTARQDFAYTSRKTAVDTVNYNLITLQAADTKTLNGLTGNPTSQFTVVIAYNTLLTTAITLILDDYIVEIGS